MHTQPSPKATVSWFSLVIASFLMFRGSSRAIDGDFGIWTWLCLGLGLFWIGQEMAKWWRFRTLEPTAPWRPHPFAAPEDEDPAQSIVFLLDAPRDITGNTWIRNLEHALGVEFKECDDATGYLIPMPHPVNEHGGECHMMSLPEGTFRILNGKRPYMEHPAESAENLKDPRLKAAVASHQAWLSVDLLALHDQTAEPAAAYPVIGKAVAALSGPDVLAIYAPEIKRLNVFDPGLLLLLSGDSPLSAFDRAATGTDPESGA